MNNSNKYLLLALLCCAYLGAQEIIDQDNLVNVYEAGNESAVPAEAESVTEAMAPVVELLAVGGSSDEMVNIGLDQDEREHISSRLNALLANEYLLQIKTQKYHWNVVGPFFGQLHKLFNKQYDQLADINDKVAERVRALGFKAFGTAMEFTEYGVIQENPGANPDAHDMIKNLLADHETIIKQLADLIQFTHDAGDAGTENFLAELIVSHQAMAWMLRAHLL